jgi:hypothetical protein
VLVGRDLIRTLGGDPRPEPDGLAMNKPIREVPAPVRR